ncbi:MAG: phenylalanine--tRNA ligase subunit beta [Chloroflexi bacterium]|nr:phenylalanine--tRNA ligase subunit beta [Chloroflexota bacterium]
MRVSLNWLREYVPVTLPAEELAHRLTMAGLEVSKIEVRGGDWQNIFVGQIVDIRPHPNADRLSLAEVDLGAERETVVCGAPNIEAGQKIPFARVGARLIDGHTGKPAVLQPAKIRGVLSKGMVCSEKELGLSLEHEGILVLPPEAPLGAPLRDFLGDSILDFEITPNRPDCLSMLGIACEAGALTGGKVTFPPAEYPEEAPPAEEFASVEIADPDLCPRYCATIMEGVRIGPSPRWMQQRLLDYGMRPINNIVDITNYVMIEYGQPLHAFDYQRIRGKKIIVRRARPEETIQSLDGVERKVTAENLMITDAAGPVAIAGVVGGANSEVTGSTTSILLESANFNRISIRRTSARLGLRSEASMRFERGLRPELAMEAVKRATRLIQELGGGKVARGIIDAYPGRAAPPEVKISPAEVKRVLGVDLPAETITGILASLGFACELFCAPEIRVTPPWWRSDISQPADVVEEVARIYGYDKIPLTLLSSPLPAFEPQPFLDLKDRVRDVLAASGMQEVINYSLTNLEIERKASLSPDPALDRSLRVVNPLSKEQEYLRLTLRSGLLATLSANQRHQETGVRIFEVGRVFLPREKDLPEERDIVAGAFCGPRTELSWHGKGEVMDFYDAKGAVENLFRGLGSEAEFVEGEDPGLLKGRTAAVKINGMTAGVLGELNPAISQNFDICGPVSLFEIELAALLPGFAARARNYRTQPKFPGATRDLAIVVDAAVPARRVKEIIKASPLVEGVVLFDVYSGEKLPQGKKSLAWRVTWQSYERTLTDEEIDRYLQDILQKLAQELGAVLRT